MANPALRQKLLSKEFFVVPGIQDMIASVIANQVGFDFVYGTGYWMTASALGLPDAGIATYTQMLERMATLVKSSHSAVIADADTGYGGLLNVHHTVRGYEAGVTAIQLEDKEFPKKCGHTPYKRCVPMLHMVDKIKVAVDSRKPRHFASSRAPMPSRRWLDAALPRLEAYARAGADVLFFEAPQSREEMVRACAAFDLPMVANMADGGKTPILTAAELAEIGYAFSIYPSMTSLVAAAAINAALRRLKDTGVSQSPDLPMFDFLRNYPRVDRLQ